MFFAMLILSASLLMQAGAYAGERQPAGAGQPVVIDVRTEAEWNAGHLEGAVLIPHDRITQGITAAVPDKKTPIYLYCRSGRRTGLALDALKKAGYENVISLDTLEKASRELQRQVVR
jgi:phage shock protein E